MESPNKLSDEHKETLLDELRKSVDKYTKATDVKSTIWVATGKGPSITVELKLYPENETGLDSPNVMAAKTEAVLANSDFIMRLISERTRSL